MAGDTLSIEEDNLIGEPLLLPVMRDGRRLAPHPTLADIRTRVERNLARLPERLRRLEPGVIYEVEVAGALVALADACDRRVAEREGRSP
jgi:nicotinate phosphoribosyltransferase